MFLSSEVHANKLVPHSELIIFIRYENNKYCFICYIQRNIIFYSTHAIFNEEIFLKYTDSHIKECKLYDKLLNKISLETESLVPNSSGKARLALVPTSHTPIPPIQNNSSTCSSLPSLFYKSISPLPTPKFKKPTVEIEEDDNFNSDVEIQPPSPQ